MPTVLCGFHCFDAPSLSTTSVEHEFLGALGLAFDGRECPLEMYRAERIQTDAVLAAGDIVMCRLPTCGALDLAAVEDLHCQLEELHERHDALKVNFERLQEALVSLLATVESSKACAAAQLVQHRADRGDAAGQWEAAAAAADQAVGLELTTPKRSPRQGAGAQQSSPTTPPLQERVEVRCSYVRQAYLNSRRPLSYDEIIQNEIAAKKREMKKLRERSENSFRKALCGNLAFKQLLSHGRGSTLQKGASGRHALPLPAGAL